MRQVLSDRTDRDHEADDQAGFTLIELMVVVLIIAILLAIAIPTFLGARGKAQARSAQSNLRNALTAEKTVYVDHSQYSDDTSQNGTLFTVEPSIKWVSERGRFELRQFSVVRRVGKFGNYGPGQVAVRVSDQNATADNVVLSAMDDSGTKCWYVTDEAAPGTNAAPGTFYASADTEGGSCPAAPPVPATMGDVATGAATPGSWGTSWSGSPSSPASPSTPPDQPKLIPA